MRAKKNATLKPERNSVAGKRTRYLPDGRKTTKDVPTKEDVDKWFEDAKSVTPDTIGDFIRQMVEVPQTYDTYVEAMSACMIAGANALENLSGGGSGNQWNCACHDLMKRFAWHGLNIGEMLGYRIIDLDDLLSPYTIKQIVPIAISRSKWNQVRRSARTLLVKNYEKKCRKPMEPFSSYNESRHAHLKSIAKGVVPDGVVVED